MNKIQKIIADEIETRGLTMASLARNSGLESSYIKNIMYGKSTNPRFDKLQKLANYLNRPLSDFGEIFETNLLNKDEYLINKEETPCMLSLHTDAVLMAKEIIEVYHDIADKNDINKVANKMCKIANHINTTLITPELALYVIKVMDSEKKE